MRFLRISWVSLSLLVSLAWVGAPLHGSAQDATPAAVTESSATADFPNGMTFDLRATIDGDVSSVDLVYAQANLETLELITATFTQDGSDLTASADADFTINFLPVGIDLTYHWVITLADESVHETQPQTATWIDDRFDWDVATGAGVEIYSYERSADFVQFMLTTAEDAVVAMKDLFQPEETWPIRIWAYASSEDYAGTLATNSQEWSAGSAYPDLQVIQAVIPDDDQDEVLRVLPHEVSHQILHMATLNPFNGPATWIDEGLATHAQIGGTEAYPRIVADAIAEGSILGLSSLISAFPFDPTQARLAYAESYSAIGFIKEQWGDDGIRAIVLAYRAGNSHEDVIQIALGMSLSDLQDAWLASVGNGASVNPGGTN